MSNNISPQNLSDEMKKAIKEKDTSTLLSSLSEEDKKLFGSLLSDEKAREEFLSSKQAQALLSALFGNR